MDLKDNPLATNDHFKIAKNLDLIATGIAGREKLHQCFKRYLVKTITFEIMNHILPNWWIDRKTDS